MSTDDIGRMHSSQQPGPLLSLSSGFEAWLEARHASLALTTYQAGRLFFIGRKPGGGIRAHERLIEQAQGLWTDGATLWVSGKWALWRLVNVLAAGERTEKGATRRFVPREARVTGRLDVHDIAMMETDGRRLPVFVNTLYSCLATISTSASFRALWNPPFISALAPEDRCHMNGLAMQGGRPAYVSALAATDTAEGWREHRRGGGVVIDVATGETVAGGLSMPHSPRVHDGQLWVLNSGQGELGVVDVGAGRFTPVAFCPGYARGLAFIDGFAVVGLSRPRRNNVFEGLALQERMEGGRMEAMAGVAVVELASGRVAHWMRFEHTIDELYDVAVLAGVPQAEAVGFTGDDIERDIRPS